MALKFDGNNNAKGVKWKVGSTTNDVKQVKFDNTIAWCKPVTLTINKISPDYIKSAYITRTATEEPTAQTGVILNSGDFAYHKDTLVATSEAADPWTTWIQGYIEPLEQFAATQTSVTVYNPNIFSGTITYTLAGTQHSINIGMFDYAIISGLVSNLSLDLTLSITDQGTLHTPYVMNPFTTTTVLASDSDPATMTVNFIGQKSTSTVTQVRTAVTTVTTIAANYLCMTPTAAAASSGGTNITLVQDSASTFPSLEYSVDGKHWDPLNGNNPIFVRYNGVNAIQHLYIKGINSTFSINPGGYHHFTATADFECSGNLMSLLDETLSSTSSVPTWCFSRLFINNTYIKSAPEMPATTLGVCCYYEMFKGCTGLLVLPIIYSSNVTLANGCCQGMFNGCTSLAIYNNFNLQSSALPSYCFYQMFNGCTSLELPFDFQVSDATTLGDHCCYQMFANCQSLTKTPNLYATTAASYCYAEMFRGCISLVDEMKVIKLTSGSSASYACASMFEGCTNLTTAIIPGTGSSSATYGSCCFAGMYYGCQSLTTILGQLTAYSFGSYCCYQMFYGCNSLTNANIDFTCSQLSACCCVSMFENCYNLLYPINLYINSYAFVYGNVFNGMYKGCTSLYYPCSFNTDESTTFANNICQEMFCDCSRIKISTTKTRDYSAPYIVEGTAASGATNCLTNMFSGHTGPWTGTTPSFNTTYYLNCDLKFSATLGNAPGVNSSWFGLTNDYTGTPYASGLTWGCGSELYIYARCSAGYAMGGSWDLVSGPLAQEDSIYRYGPVYIYTNDSYIVTPTKYVYVSANIDGASTYYISTSDTSYAGISDGARYLPQNTLFYVITVGLSGRPAWDDKAGIGSILSGTWGENGCIYSGVSQYSSETDDTKVVTFAMGYGYRPSLVINGNSVSTSYRAYICKSTDTYDWRTSTGTLYATSVFSFSADGLPLVCCGYTATTPDSSKSNTYCDINTYSWDGAHSHTLGIWAEASKSVPSSSTTIYKRSNKLIGQTNNSALLYLSYYLTVPTLSQLSIGYTANTVASFGLDVNTYNSVFARNDRSTSITVGTGDVIVSAWTRAQSDIYATGGSHKSHCVMWSSRYCTCFSTQIFSNISAQVGNRSECRYAEGKTVYIGAVLTTAGYDFPDATLISGTRGDVGAIYLVKTISNIAADQTFIFTPTAIDNHFIY